MGERFSGNAKVRVLFTVPSRQIMHSMNFVITPYRAFEGLSTGESHMLKSCISQDATWREI